MSGLTTDQSCKKCSRKVLCKKKRYVINFVVHKERKNVKKQIYEN